ncbi:autophagy-related protein 18g isoform X2 [Cryptomeria japonica]|uniref:autophagy-related protein 18g isoform X2 n=1 Tax=Cryptomeria japonica TaxID=3369 RepID=UPI0027DA08CD|nr:autophagy-related protein 18g isoform X2 [Cryptomeria japonica]
MRNEVGVRRRNSRKGSFFPTSFRVISSYLKTVSGNASSIASTVCSAGASVASSVAHTEDDLEREQVQWAGFDKLELGAGNVRHVLLLTYKNGFQVWDVENADNVQELVSKRDGPVAFLRMQPEPSKLEPEVECFQDSRPLLLVVTEDETTGGDSVQGGFGTGYDGDEGSPTQTGSSYPVPTVIQFYSFRSHTYVHELKFRSAIYMVRCSTNIIAVALATQIYCYDAATLETKFSLLTYPIPQGGQGPLGLNIGYGPMDVGPRWLAYAANHAMVQNTGRVSPQNLTPSPGVSPSTSPANGSLVAHYAKESSKQIAAGIVTIGDMGFKKLTRYCSELLPDDSSFPGSGSTNWKNKSNGFAGHTYEPEYAGMVVVRDFVSKSIVAQFRAHNSPLSALCFDPSGTLLVTASIHGHSLNVYRIMAPSIESGLRHTLGDPNMSHVHLYKLNRGLTNAVIQDISFSYDSHWIAISTLKGTTHLFAISPYGGVVGAHTHGDGSMNGSRRCVLAPSSTLPWWSNNEPLKINQQALSPPPHPINLSVVTRIKNGNGMWHNPVSSAAAVATGKMKSPAVAALFHNSSGCNVENDLGKSLSKDQLWVFSSSGHLIRYAFHTTGHEYVSHSSNGGIGVHPSGPSQTQDFGVFVEPLQKWDVARKLNWVEREENVDNLSCETLAGEISQRGLEGYGNSTAISNSTDNESSEKEEIIAKEKHCEYISNAEMQTHQRWPPVWAKSEICFYSMISKSTNEESSDVVGSDGEIDIENIQTCIVESRKTDLVPVFEPHQNFKNLQEKRESESEVYSVVSPLQFHWMKDGSIQDSIDDHLQVSSGGSSYNSQDGCFHGNPMIRNGFLHANQDSEEHMKGMLFLDSLSGHYLKHGPTSPDIEEISISLRKLRLPNREFNGKYHSQTGKLVSIESPPMDIAVGGNGVVFNMQISEEVRVAGSLKSFSMHESGINKKQLTKHDVTDRPQLVSRGHILNSGVSQGDCRCPVGNEHLGIEPVNKKDHFPSIKGTEFSSRMATPIKEQDEIGWEGSVFPFCVED